jgi:hypothetical protein
MLAELKKRKPAIINSINYASFAATEMQGNEIGVSKF